MGRSFDKLGLLAEHSAAVERRLSRWCEVAVLGLVGKVIHGDTKELHSVRSLALLQHYVAERFWEKQHRYNNATEILYILLFYYSIIRKRAFTSSSKIELQFE